MCMIAYLFILTLFSVLLIGRLLLLHCWSQKHKHFAAPVIASVNVFIFLASQSGRPNVV